MQEIKINGRVAGYEKDKKHIRGYMDRESSITNVEIDENERRIITFDNGDIMSIQEIDKEYGTNSGDICSVCKKGELRDYGGCATCSHCNAQIKCGL